MAVDYIIKLVPNKYFTTNSSIFRIKDKDTEYNDFKKSGNYSSFISAYYGNALLQRVNCQQII